MSETEEKTNVLDVGATIAQSRERLALIPEHLPRFLPIGTKTYAGVTANSALQLVDDEIVPGLREKRAEHDRNTCYPGGLSVPSRFPDQYIGYLVGDGFAVLGMVSIYDIAWPGPRREIVFGNGERMLNGVKL
jgi:hypothetical protein